MMFVLMMMLAVLGSVRLAAAVLERSRGWRGGGWRELRREEGSGVRIVDGLLLGMMVFDEVGADVDHHAAA